MVVRAGCGCGHFDLSFAANELRQKRTTLLWARCNSFRHFHSDRGVLGNSSVRVRRASSTMQVQEQKQIVTPPGMSTITVTASSGSLTPQQMRLALTVH